METTTHTSPTVRQISGKDPSGNFILAVLVKRTYTFDGRGRLTLGPEQVPLFDEPIVMPEDPDLILHDSDEIPWKPLTDIVLVGHAYAPNPSVSFDASLSIRGATKSVLVIGDRRCMLSNSGKIIFSEPESVDSMPIRYDLAYGGRDAVAEAALGDPAAELKTFLSGKMPTGASPYSYPRNSIGRGYIIESTRAAVEQLTLPNIEDPIDRLSPDRLVVGNVNRWPLMPIPHSFGVVNHGWFPRIAYLGVVMEHEPLNGPIAEVARGFAPDYIMDPSRPVEQRIEHRFMNGASLGLQLDGLRGDEPLLLVNLHRRHTKLELSLPGERPKIFTDGRNGKLNATDPMIHTITIEPDTERVTVVWRGAAPAIRPYLPEELERMPLKVVW